MARGQLASSLAQANSPSRARPYQLEAHVRREPPADHDPAEAVEDGGEVAEALSCTFEIVVRFFWPRSLPSIPCWRMTRDDLVTAHVDLTQAQG